MPSLEELMRNVLHILHQSDLQNRVLYRGETEMTANYMAESLLSIAQTCNHVWEDDNEIPDKIILHEDDNGSCYVKYRCSKCYKEGRQVVAYISERIFPVE